jgi:TPP-dependent pyruvate/acetoin dehydrogenase alpha subunit
MLNVMSSENSMEMYFEMYTIRAFEEKVALEYPKGEMRTPTHLGIGQEAIAVGVLWNRSREDVVFSHHRCHNHYLAAGGPRESLFAELLGKETGCSGGRGGSVHLVSRDHGFYGSSPILGQSVSLATGAAFAKKKLKQPGMVIVFFGDAVFEEGVVWESFNFASLHSLPILFVCENNLYSTESSLEKRIAKESRFIDRADSFGIQGEIVDGNDVKEVYSKARMFQSEIRKGDGPRILECSTYRWREHVGPMFDWEANRNYRTEKEIREWMARCPVARLRSELLANGQITSQELEKREREIDDLIRIEYLNAQSASFPSTESGKHGVFASELES